MNVLFVVYTYIIIISKKFSLRIVLWTETNYWPSVSGANQINKVKNDENWWDLRIGVDQIYYTIVYLTVDLLCLNIDYSLMSDTDNKSIIVDIISLDLI